MYSPVFLSWPTTSGSPPVLSISLSDHSFSALASSFACTLAHSRPLWRFRFFSKRSFNALSSSSRCFGDNSFLLLFMLFIVWTAARRVFRLDEMVTLNGFHGFAGERFADGRLNQFGEPTTSRFKSQRDSIIQPSVDGPSRTSEEQLIDR